MRPLIVGINNPYSINPNDALLPWPEGSAGQRLANLILGLSNEEYIRRFDRCNLLDGDWSWTAARFAAAAIRHERLILLGERVAGAFWLKYEPLAVRALGSSRRALMLPHPSGRNLYYNDPKNIAIVRQVVIEFEDWYCK